MKKAIHTITWGIGIGLLLAAIAIALNGCVAARVLCTIGMIC